MTILENTNILPGSFSNYAERVQAMNLFRSIPVVIALLALYSAQASAYQYGMYVPSAYTAPAYYSSPYPVPYYPAYRYPAQPRYPAPQSVPAERHRPAAKAQSDQPETVSPPAINANKQEFVNTLLPYIEKENKRLLVLRKDILRAINKIQAQRTLRRAEKQRLLKLAKDYRVNGDVLKDAAAREELMQKIDVIPASLALAQAANESAWGKSRFAREANNLYGIWTYDESKGLKPKNREQGKTHLVRIFDDIGDSVLYYMHTLNSHPAYNELRDIRQQQRASNRPIDGHKLAAGLEKYSARGQEYIDLIQQLIRQNDWALLDTQNHKV